MLANGNQSQAANEQNVPERSDTVQHRLRAVFDELGVAEQFLQRVKTNVLMYTW